MSGRVGDMPLIIDYSLCNQAVTLYSYDNGEITRTQYDRAYFEHVEKETIDNQGEHGKTEHLIVIPGNVPCSPGMRAYLGVGATLDNIEDAAAWWRALIPSKDNNVVIVRSVSPRYWRGEIVHVELRG